MNKTVRNGLAILGMAGGVWFLGQAVANADTTVNANQTSTNTTDGKGSDAGSANIQKIAVDNSTNNTVSNGSVYGGDGGTAIAVSNTGVNAAGSGGSITTGDATSAAQANGGNASQSNTSVVGNGGGGGGNVTVNANQTNTNIADGKHSDAGGFNLQKIWVDNSTNNTVENGDVYGGEGGFALALSNTGFNFVQGCHHPEVVSIMTETNRHRCEGGGSITTGDANSAAQANGGNASQSNTSFVGNATVPNMGANAPAKKEEHAAVKHVAAAVKPSAVSAAVLSNAQPSAALATTGAEYGTPLALGLIALGAGAGLTVAGRRRASAKV